MVGQGFGVGRMSKGCAFAPAGCLSASRGLGGAWQAERGEEVAGFLSATAFVFGALRDSVLAPNGCSLLFLHFIIIIL